MSLPDVTPLRFYVPPLILNLILGHYVQEVHSIISALA